MLIGLYNAELNKTCLFFMLQHKNKIMTVLDHQLVNLRKYNTHPRAPIHDLAGLRSTYSFEKVGNSTRSDEMMKTEQIPLEVNAMQRLILEESEDERGEMSGDINAFQARDSCFFCKKTGHQKTDCQSYKDWKKKNLNRKTENMNRKPVFCHNCEKEGHMSGRRDQQQN